MSFREVETYVLHCYVLHCFIVHRILCRVLLAMEHHWCLGEINGLQQTRVLHLCPYPWHTDVKRCTWSQDLFQFVKWMASIGIKIKSLHYQNANGHYVSSITSTKITVSMCSYMGNTWKWWDTEKEISGKMKFFLPNNEKMSTPPHQ